MRDEAGQAFREYAVLVAAMLSVIVAIGALPRFLSEGVP